MNHIIVRNVIVSAQMFGITMTELAEWENLVRDDFIMRNAAHHPSGVLNMEYLVHFNTCLKRIPIVFQNNASNHDPSNIWSKYSLLDTAKRGIKPKD
jgi:hypothetical protein